jgi:hypothetical protein
VVTVHRMRIDLISTAIVDLSDDEAVSLRALCEKMLHGATSLDHPLFQQWVAENYPSRSAAAPPTLFAVAFLPRALHALLVREESLRIDAESSAPHPPPRAGVPVGRIDQLRLT